jgi:hypothetical protein
MRYRQPGGAAIWLNESSRSHPIPAQSLEFNRLELRANGVSVIPIGIEGLAQF